MPRTGRSGFIWFPREDTPAWEITINGDNVREDCLPGTRFTKGILPEIGDFSIMLINADEKYSDKYSQGQTVKLYLDLASGTTERFEGKIDDIKNTQSQNMGFTTIIKGSHLTHELAEIRVVESYPANSSFTDITSDLESKYLTAENFLSDYSITNTLTSTSVPTFNWDEKPFLDVILDIVKEADGEAFVTDDKVITLRDQNSVENNAEAIVWNDTLIDTGGLGTQSLTTKNKIKVYGDDGTGLPVLYTKNNTTSQTELQAIKEDVIYDTEVNNSSQAKERAEAESTYEDTSGELEGDVVSFILPSLVPADKIWITNPPNKIHQQSRVQKFTHTFPDERTISTIGRVRNTPKIFKRRAEKEREISVLTNPFKMVESWNITFDAESDVASKESNVQIAEGKISLASGTQGIFTLTKTFDFDVSEVQLRGVGSNLKDVLVEWSSDDVATYQTLAFTERTELTTVNAGAIVRVTISNINTEIDSLAFLVK